MSMSISAEDPHPRKYVDVLDTTMAYVDTGRGQPVVFLHGNPTNSYLWRNVIRHVAPVARCLAPDSPGTGQSGDMPSKSYRFVDLARYMDAWFDAVVGTEPVVLVIHDWGSAIGFHFARRFPERVRAIVYMEAIVKPFSWEDFPEAPGEPRSSRAVFKQTRTPGEGEELILQNNYFVEERLPARILRPLSEAEMAAYSERFKEPGDSRLPHLIMAREVPIEGEPADVFEIVKAYGAFLQQTEIPKLFIKAEPGGLLREHYVDFCRTFPNQREISVRGIHFIQEDSPDEIGEAVTEFIRDL